ncbi:MAG: von Willebrand factor type A domain-containing protein [Bacteroidota bacterium]|nr:von Willebrand factor type A domain-containing protein [Bacteroidota bacterium]
MLRKILIPILFVCAGAFAQTNLNVANNNASICGRVNDKTSKESIPFANVILTRLDSNAKYSTSSDLNGDFCFKQLAAGKYKVEALYIGYTKQTITNIVINNNQKKEVKIVLNSQGVELNELEIVTTKTDTKLQHDGKKYKICKESFAGNVSYNSPVAVPTYNTEEYSKINDNEFKEATKNPLSTLSIDVDKASYSNVRRFITQGNLPPADAVRVEEMINYFNYNYPQPKNEDPFSITTEYTECAWNKKHNLIHIGIQGKEIKTDKMPANNLVFLIDVSGSMLDANKLPLLKSGLRLLVDQLRPEDKVSLVVYAGAAGVVLPATSGNNKEKINDAIEQLQAGGSTAGGEGILLAYKTAKENFITNGNNRIILATDGDFNVGVSSDGELVRLIEKKREEGVFLTVLGFGGGNYKDSKMEQLADKGNGNYAYIDNILEAKKVLVKEMGGTLLTIAKDVKIQIEFNPAKVKAYRLIGYENRLLNNEDFNDDKKDAGELGAGHTVTAIYEIIPAGSDEVLASVDPLKYQQPITAPNKSTSDEVMTIKFRYKKPNENTSKLITETVLDKKKALSSASENCKFSSAVAEFGMILRDSKFKGDADYKSVLAMAKQSKGKDDEGYRAEFIRLVEMAQLLKKSN